MARHHRLQILEVPMRWRKGCIDRVLHTCDGQFPSEEALAAHMKKVLLAQFGAELRDALLCRKAGTVQQVTGRAASKRKPGERRGCGPKDM